MIKLPPLLYAIPGIQHSLYADDITIWATGGSDGDLQDRLQQAADAVHDYITPKGLACSPQKLLFYQPPKPGRRKKDVPNIQVLIPHVECIRVLGLRVQANGANTATISAFISSAEQISRLNARIANTTASRRQIYCAWFTLSL